MIPFGRCEDDEATSIKYISSEDLASWMYSHSNQPTRNAAGTVEWTLFVPSKERSPLVIHDESSDGEGGSITLSPPISDESRINNVYPNGVSVVNLPEVGETKHVDLARVHDIYKDEISQSLVHVVGFLRAIHGLPASPQHGNGERERILSFWELELVARSQYHSALKYAFQETDALLALLHEHGSTLALPVDVAQNLNHATGLLRQSISLIEQGFPAIYANALLRSSMRYIDLVQTDHQFHELPYFAPDHYLAVFSPLVLPLFLPMIAGLVREIKRFRELQRKKVIT